MVMTASASVVAADRVMEVLNFWFDGSMRVDRNSELVAQLAALLPQPAEQDAREAVAWRYRDKGRADGWKFSSTPVYLDPEWGIECEPLYAALTQAAPDGWRLVPVEPTETMLAAGESAAWDFWNSMPAIRAMPKAWSAMLSASPAPQADGWRPIETAPKDGTWIVALKLGHLRSGEPIAPQTCRWDGAEWEDSNGHDLEGYEPDFWMPLPPAPPAQGAGS